MYQKAQQPNPQAPASVEARANGEGVALPSKARFERPRARRLGALPTVTTAFGGSFTP